MLFSVCNPFLGAYVCWLIYFPGHKVSNSQEGEGREVAKREEMGRNERE